MIPALLQKNLITLSENDEFFSLKFVLCGRIRGIFLQLGQTNVGLNWRMALICFRNRRVLITEFKKETGRVFLFWPELPSGFNRGGYIMGDLLS